jgi:Arm DNA-binding domain
VLRVQPSGHRSFKFVYSKKGDAQWFHIGTIGLKDARRFAAKLRLAVAEGKDPLAERQAQNGVAFADLHRRYLNEHAKKKNKSWQQADYLIQRHVMPKWGNRDAKTITRADARASWRASGANFKLPVYASPCRERRAAATRLTMYPPKADICDVTAHVSYGPKADICSAMKCRASLRYLSG